MPLHKDLPPTFLNAFYPFLDCLNEEENFMNNLDFQSVETLQDKKQTGFNTYIQTLKALLSQSDESLKNNILDAHDIILKKMQDVYEQMEIDSLIFGNIVKSITKCCEKPKVAYGPYKKMVVQGKPSIKITEM